MPYGRASPQRGEGRKKKGRGRETKRGGRDIKTYKNLKRQRKAL